MWDMETGKIRYNLTFKKIRRPGWTYVVKFTISDRHLVHVDYDTLQICDLENGKVAHAFRIDDTEFGQIHALAITADGRHGVTATNGRVLLWDFSRTQVFGNNKPHAGAVRAVAFSANGRCAISASDDKTLRVWDLESFQTIHILEGHSGRVNAVAITDDGRRAVSASDDKTLRVWDLDTGEAIHILEDHWDKKVLTVALTEGGKNAISIPRNLAGYGSPDANLIRLWNLEDGQLMRTISFEVVGCNELPFLTTSDGKYFFASDGLRLSVLSLDTYEKTQYN